MTYDIPTRSMLPWNIVTNKLGMLHLIEHTKLHCFLSFRRKLVGFQAKESGFLFKDTDTDIFKDTEKKNEPRVRFITKLLMSN